MEGLKDAEILGGGFSKKLESTEGLLPRRALANTSRHALHGKRNATWGLIKSLSIDIVELWDTVDDRRYLPPSSERRESRVRRLVVSGRLRQDMLLAEDVGF